MAKEVKKQNQEKVIEKKDETSFEKLKNKVEQFRQEDIYGNKSIIFNMEKMREIIHKIKDKEMLPHQKKIIQKILKKSGSRKGIVGTWYNVEEVKILIAVVEENE
jgi:hypothetical protein